MLQSVGSVQNLALLMPVGKRRLDMTHETLINEKRYLACLCMIQKMREMGLVSASEYEQARQLLIERYQPKISVLFE